MTADTVADLRASASLFVRVVIGATPDPQQEAILNAISEPGAHVSVRSGHNTGKSACMSWIILWFLSMHPHCRIPCTAPTAHQLFDILWAEIAKWKSQMRADFAQDIEITSDTICVKGHEKLRFGTARTARKEKPEALQGSHAENLLMLIDEASGVDDSIFEAAEGNLASPGARVLLVGNPTRPDGYFHRTHNKDRGHWTCMKLSSEDSTLADKNWVKRMETLYGRDSNVFKVRVLGEFPTVSDDTLIPLDLVLSAIGRDITVDTSQKRIAGLDVARFGDDMNALIIRSGQVVLSLEQWGQVDLMQTAGRAAQAFRDGLYDVIYVDVIGMGGGVVDRLRELGIPCVPVNVSESPSDTRSERFNSLRDQLWWYVRDWFHGRICRIDPSIKLKDDLAAELSAVRYGLTSSGKFKVESKDEMKKRGLHSPNLSDALCHTFFSGPSIGVGSVKSRARPVKVANALGWT